MSYLNNVDDAIDLNADLAEAIGAAGAVALRHRLGLDQTQKIGQQSPWHGTAKAEDVDNVRMAVKQLYRDWSAEGKSERDACYGPVLEELIKAFPNRKDAGNGVKVLVPGAGLCRLLFEIKRSGFHVQGVEMSYHALLTSSFILNETAKAEEWPLYPFAYNFANNQRAEDQLQCVMIPDVCPQAEEYVDTDFSSMSMKSGDFTALYKSEEVKHSFDAVATVFFIDTGRNIIEYIETMKNCLKSGGTWINLGPLQWHANPREHIDGAKDHTEEINRRQTSGSGHTKSEMSGLIDPPETVVLDLVRHFGFDIIKHETVLRPTGYIQNPHSMLQHIYRTSYWVAIKK